MYILGISAFYHDSSATLIKNNKIVFGAHEERFTRIKHDNSFPINTITECLKHANLGIDDIDKIIFYEKPLLKFHRLIRTYIDHFPFGFFHFYTAMKEWICFKLFLKQYIQKKISKISKSNKKHSILFSQHHLSHAASAFFPSPYEKAIILCIDGVGEWNTTSAWIGEQNKINPVLTIEFPHSLGLLYSAFTSYCGFKVNSGEYKLMGLAPYGKPIYYNLIKSKLVEIYDDGTFNLNLKYFSFYNDFTMTNKLFDDLFLNNLRPRESTIKKIHMDIAASIQKITEEIVMKIAISLKDKYKIKNLCLAGGVALNCVANGRILENKIFENIWIQPSSGDAGGSLGAALSYLYLEQKFKRSDLNNIDNMQGSYLGKQYDYNTIKDELEKNEIIYSFYNERDLIDLVANDIIDNKIIGLFQGRSEFGPRALGNRSIIADPRNKNMQKNMNLKIKFRESFRPFAPAILEDQVSNYFNINSLSPYMLLTSEIKQKYKKNLNTKDQYDLNDINEERSIFPSITHIDFSSRIQTVSKQTNPKFYKIIDKFYKKTNCPMVINTSFNVRGEPIVETPFDAIKCFFQTDIDILIIENFYIKKNNQKKSLYEKKWLERFELD